MADTIFYDGYCGLCHRLVRFVLAVDRAGAFRFAPFDSESIVVRTLDGEPLVRWAASLYILQRLGGIWRLMGNTFDVLPRGFLDRCYDRVARVRKRIFREPEDVCPRVPPHLRSRFDL